MEYDGRKIIAGRPYATVYYPEHHLAQKDGTVGVHILVAEKILGRELTSFEVVHHIDFDKYNYNESNIIVFDNIKSHSTYHACLRYGYNFILTRKDGVYTCERLSKTKRELASKTKRKLAKTRRKHSVHRNYRCPLCGKIKSQTAHSDTMCIDCYNKMRHKNSKCPSKKELEKTLRECKGFQPAGKVFGVSDNAVRKWCRYYGLPDKTLFWRN